MKKKIYLQQKRRYLKKIIGTSAKPRLSVFRSHQHIYAQLIDDQTSHTLASSSTLEKDLILTNSSATQSSAFIIGENLALKALKKKYHLLCF
jgi:large subunit ribosomal protein L18